MRLITRDYGILTLDLDTALEVLYLDTENAIS